jgi:zinc protease
MLDEAGIQRRKTLQAAAARRLVQTRATVPRRLFYARLYGADDPFVRSLLPGETGIASIAREDVARFHRDNFQPRTTTVIVVGDVTEEQATSAVTRVFQSWTAPNATVTARPTSDSAATRGQTSIYLHDVPGTQAYVYVGTRGPTRTSADFYAVETMGAISGTRMQQSLRDRRSLMYSGNSGVIWRHVPRLSAFVGSSVVNATKVDSAIVEWLSLLRGLRGERPVTSQELEAARRSRVDPLPARIDGADSLAARIADMVRDDVPLDFFDRYAGGMSNVSASDVTAAASKYIDLDHLIIVVTGDRSVIEPALRAANIASVVLVDANGKPIDK